VSTDQGADPTHLRQGMPHPHGLCTDPGGNFVLVAGGSVFSFDIFAKPLHKLPLLVADLGLNAVVRPPHYKQRYRLAVLALRHGYTHQSTVYRHQSVHDTWRVRTGNVFLRC
jgi:hypothetical protein